MTAGYLNTLEGISRTCYIKSLEIPVITCQDHTCTFSLEIQYRTRSAVRIGNHIDSGICSSTDTSVYRHRLIQCISTALQHDHLARSHALHCGINIHRITVGTASRTSSLRSSINNRSTLYIIIYCKVKCYCIIATQQRIL